jgi:ketosteroid isomerase-like protein
MWAGLDRKPGMPWPPPPEEFDRRIRFDLCDEQIEIRNVEQMPVGSRYDGHAGVRQWAIEVWEVFSEVRNEINELIEVDDSTVVSVQTTRARMRHTELQVDLTWAVVWTLKDGKVLQANGYVTRRQALEAAGLEA